VKNGTNIRTTDFLDGFQYTGGELNFFPTSEGYVKATPINRTNTEFRFNYIYNYTDHLGNVRVSYTLDPQTGKLRIVDEHHYYPFGLRHEVHYPSGNRLDFHPSPTLNGGQIGDPVQLINVTKTEYMYRYNGKEFQDELGLNMYAMDMRMYDPAIARWVVIDPVTHHSQSTYMGFDGNPVYWADPSGASVTVYTGQAAIDFFISERDRLDDEIARNQQENDGARMNDEYASGFDVNKRNYFGERELQKDIQLINSDKKKDDYHFNINNNCPECWWLQNNEYLTFEEAIWHYRLGKGKPVYVRLNKLDLSKVRVKDFIGAKYSHQGYPMIYANFDLDYYTNPNQALIYGSIALVYLGENTIMALPDTYDFDLKFRPTLKGFIRDFATQLGSLYNGGGTPYTINFLVTAKIKD